MTHEVDYELAGRGSADDDSAPNVCEACEGTYYPGYNKGSCEHCCPNCAADCDECAGERMALHA